MLLFRQGLVSHLRRMMMSGFCQGCIFPSVRPPYLCCIIELFDSLSVISEQYKLSNVPPPAQFLIFLYYILTAPHPQSKYYSRSVLVRNPFEIPFFGYKQVLTYYFPGNQILIRFLILPPKHEVLLRLKLSGKLSKLYTVHQSCVCTSHASAWYLRHFGHLHPFWQFSWMTSLINRICFSSYRFVLDISTKREARNCSFLNRYVRSHINILVIWM